MTDFPLITPPQIFGDGMMSAAFLISHQGIISDAFPTDFVVLDITAYITSSHLNEITNFTENMVKGKATATVSGRTIAETDEYEIVEGNVYVRFSSPSNGLNC